MSIQARLESKKKYKTSAKGIAKAKARYLVRRKHILAGMRERWLFNQYGLSLDEYEALLAKQDHRCAICLKPQKDFKRNLAVDHNHETGHVRGLLCFHCNSGIGHFDESLTTLRRAEDYLAKEI